MSETVYNREFQEYLTLHASKSAEKIMKLVCDWFKPNSIVDFGCGVGDFFGKRQRVNGRWGDSIGT